MNSSSVIESSKFVAVTSERRSRRAASVLDFFSISSTEGVIENSVQFPRNRSFPEGMPAVGV